MVEQVIKIDLSISEINFILSALGELPSKTGAWNLIVAIKEQADPQFIPPVEDISDPEELLG